MFAKKGRKKGDSTGKNGKARQHYVNAAREANLLRILEQTQSKEVLVPFRIGDTR